MASDLIISCPGCELRCLKARTLRVWGETQTSWRQHRLHTEGDTLNKLFAYSIVASGTLTRAHPLHDQGRDLAGGSHPREAGPKNEEGWHGELEKSMLGVFEFLRTFVLFFFSLSFRLGWTILLGHHDLHSFPHYIWHRKRKEWLMNLKNSGEWYMGGFGGRNRKREMV